MHLYFFALEVFSLKMLLLFLAWVTCYCILVVLYDHSVKAINKYIDIALHSWNGIDLFANEIFTRLRKHSFGISLIYLSYWFGNVLKF